MLPAKPEKDFVYVVHQVLGVISDERAIQKRLSIVEWGKHEPKFDIRLWDVRYEDNTKASRGIALSLEEMKKLKEILNSLDLENFEMPEKKIVPRIY